MNVYKKEGKNGVYVLDGKKDGSCENGGMHTGGRKWCIHIRWHKSGWAKKTSVFLTNQKPCIFRAPRKAMRFPKVAYIFSVFAKKNKKMQLKPMAGSSKGKATKVVKKRKQPKTHTTYGTVIWNMVKKRQEGCGKAKIACRISNPAGVDRKF